MENITRKERERVITRRKVMQGMGAGMLAVGSVPELLARSSASGQEPTTEEKDTLFGVLTFWVAVTNPTMSLPTTSARIAELTTFPDDEVLKAAVDYVNSRAADYKNISKEFLKLEKFFKYGPGECPKELNTLKQMSALKPKHT
jgi:hypothetical protein